jgi:hypothetical protein
VVFPGKKATTIERQGVEAKGKLKVRPDGKIEVLK